MSHIVGSAWVRTRVARLRATALSSVLVMLAVLVPTIALTATPSSAAAVNPPANDVSFTLEGCRLPVSNTTHLPLYTLPLSGKFICKNQTWDGSNDDYTTGNLGKSWNELDLVPFRVVIGTGNTAAPAFTIAAALDAFDAGHPGYDVISAPTLNPGSDAGCPTVTAGSQTTADPGLGGIDQSIYRRWDLAGTPANSDCVYDFYGRLALGSHLFPGASLHANLALVDPASTNPDGITTSGIGSRDVSIPVNEISPQELNKDMTATQGSDHVWNIVKSPTPANLSFTNTCDTSQPLSAHVNVTVTWTKQPAVASGPITVITHVYATNPASRVITIQGSDDIRSGTTVLDTAPFGPTDVPANTANFPVLTHTFLAPSGATNLNDIATATYTDLVTGVPIPGQTSATASANVQLSGVELNQTATINDVETITGSGLTFSTDSFSGASGSFDNGYNAGTPTTGPVSWTSASQGGSGSVTFNKTVYATQGSIEPTGDLHDVATLNGSDGFTASAFADVNISVNTFASLTISKSIPNVLQTGESQNFVFDVTGPGGYTNHVTLSFGAGDTSQSTTINGLTPGSYTVHEQTATGWLPQPNQTVDLSGSICSGTASFHNAFTPARATAVKITNPAGFEGGWTLTLTGPGGPETQVTDSGGNASFATSLQEGIYTITETPQPGWVQDSVPCTFTVNYPADAGRVFSCTFHNTYQPHISLTKEGPSLSKIGDPVTYVITLTNTSLGGGAAGAPSLSCSVFDSEIGFTKNNVVLGPGEVDTSFVPFTIPPGASDPFPNTAHAVCVVPGSGPTLQATADSNLVNINLFQPGVHITKSGRAFARVGDTVTYNITITNTSSSDSPDLLLASFSDSVVSTATPPASCNDLAPGASCSFSYTYVVQAGDADPLTNTATVHYHPQGFPNDITDHASSTLDVLHPSFTVNKICTSAQPVPLGATSATFQVRFNNTGDTDLVITADDGIGTFTLAAGGHASYTVTVNGPFTGGSIDNTVHTTSVTTAAKYGLTNNTVGNQSSSASCQRGGLTKVIKTVSGAAPSGTQAFTFTLRTGASMLSDGTTLETLTANAGNGGILNFTTNLVPGQHYQMCEDVMPGWNTTLPAPLFVPNSFITPTLPNPNAINLTVCTDFVATAGGTTTFTVDNSPPPGGRALTIGFWKNWASCASSSGNKKPVLDQTLAIASTSPNIGLVVSAQNMGSGWSVYAPTYYLILSGSTTNKNVAPSCSKAVNLLNKSTATKGTKMASDPLFNMTAQLIGAQLNMFAGAGVSGTTVVNVNKAVLLNGKYQFNGDTYTPKLTAADTTLANCLATQLDNYNNDRPVSGC
jgi:hypothetical protein